VQPIAAVQPVVNIAMATTLPVFIKAELLEIISKLYHFQKFTILLFLMDCLLLFLEEKLFLKHSSIIFKINITTGW